MAGPAGPRPRLSPCAPREVSDALRRGRLSQSCSRSPSNQVPHRSPKNRGPAGQARRLGSTALVQGAGPSGTGGLRPLQLFRADCRILQQRVGGRCGGSASSPYPLGPRARGAPRAACSATREHGQEPTVNTAHLVYYYLLPVRRNGSSSRQSGRIPSTGRDMQTESI